MMIRQVSHVTFWSRHVAAAGSLFNLNMVDEA
jgi:hypothetical protein